MLWLAEDQARCGSCSQFLDESMDPERKTAWIAEPRICWSCAARTRATTDDKGHHKQQAPGTLWVTRDRSAE